MILTVKHDGGCVSEVVAGKEYDFMKKVAERLVEKGECETFADAILCLARFGANNTPRFIF